MVVQNYLSTWSHCVTILVNVHWLCPCILNWCTTIVLLVCGVSIQSINRSAAIMGTEKERERERERDRERESEIGYM